MQAAHMLGAVQKGKWAEDTGIYHDVHFLRDDLLGCVDTVQGRLVWLKSVQCNEDKDNMGRCIS